MLIYPIKIKFIKKDKTLLFIKNGSFFTKQKYPLNPKKTLLVGTKNRISPSLQLNLGKNHYYLKLRIQDKDKKTKEINLYPKILYFTRFHHLFSETEIKELSKFLGIGYKLS